MCNSQALVKRDGPVDAIYAAHPLELGVGHWFDLIDIFDAWIHDPNVGLSGVEDLAGRPQHQAGEDRNLVRHQHCRKGDAENKPDVLGPIAKQHPKCDAIHASLLICRLRHAVSCNYRYMRAAPEDVLTSLFCTRRSLVSVRERITPHFLFECHHATLQMFEVTCVDSFVQIAQYFPDASYPGVPFR